MKVVSLLSLILLPSLFGGCFSFNSEAGCVPIAFPGPGSSFHVVVEYPPPRADVPPSIHSNWSILGPEEIVGGDGLLHPVVRVTALGATSIDFVSLSTGDMISYLSPTGWGPTFRLNDGLWLGNLFFGRCLSSGQRWEAPYYAPDGGLEVSVLEASRNGIRAQVLLMPYETSVYGNGTIGGLLYHFTWDTSRSLPDEVRTSRWPPEDPPRTRAIRRLLDANLVPLEVTPSERIVPVGVTKPVARWPSFEFDGAPLPFGDFVADTEARSDVRDYLTKHPRAYASFVRYVYVQENESSAAWWRAVMRDESAEAIEVELVHRCFQNPVDRALYGECMRTRQYFGPGSFNQREDARVHVKPMPIPENLSSVSAQDVLRIASGFAPGDNVASIEWRAHPWDSGAREYGNATGRPGWVVSIGSITGKMVRTTQGPMGADHGSGYREDVRLLDMDAVGWATSWTNADR